jgi:adenylate kinase
MFRAAIAAGTEFGRTIEPLLANGILVPDEVTISLIRDRLSEGDARNGFVLDGFPRNVAQADALDEMLAREGLGLDAILFFDLPDEIGLKRAISRAQIENRVDDTPEVIAKRLATYHAETEPIVEHYRVTGKLVPLHAGRTIEEVWSEISSALQQLGEDEAA